MSLGLVFCAIGGCTGLLFARLEIFGKLVAATRRFAIGDNCMGFSEELFSTQIASGFFKGIHQGKKPPRYTLS